MKPEASTPVLLTALWVAVAVPTMTAVLWTWYAQTDAAAAMRLQRGRVNDLDARAAQFEVDVDTMPVGDVPELAERIGQCEAKLADVRHVLEVLIRTEQTTGRARWSLEALPRPVSDWPAWPCRGQHIGSITERSHPCDRERAAR